MSGPGGYSLHATEDNVDTWAFERDVRALLDVTAPAEQVVERAARLRAAWANPYEGIEGPGPRRHAERLIELDADLRLAWGDALLDL